MTRGIFFTTFVCLIFQCAFGGGVYDIRDFGAKPESGFCNTKQINAAIEKCSKDGGGTVLVKGGEYTTGSVVLKDNVSLKIEKDAVLKGTTNLNDYVCHDDSTGKALVRAGKWTRGLVFASYAKNIEICGEGTIDGGHVEDPTGEEQMRGPHAVFLVECENITVKDIKIKRASNYALVMVATENVVVRNIDVREGWDGIHIRVCKNLLVENCQVRSGDDALAGGYWDKAIVRNCYLNSACNGVRFIHPVKNVLMENLQLKGPGEYAHRTSYKFNKNGRKNMLCGLSIQPGAWGYSPGEVKNVKIKDVEIDNVGCPLYILANFDVEVDGVLFENIKATNCRYIPLSVATWRKSTSIKDVAFKNVSVEYVGDAPDYAVKASTKKAPLTEINILPYWGFFAKNAKDLKFENFAISCKSPDKRPAVGLENSSIKELKNFTINGKVVKNLK